MAVSDGLIETLQDLLAGAGPVAVKRMFSGVGLFCDGRMFGLVASDVLYLKADETSCAAFDREQLPPFSYATKNGTRSIASYRRAPERLLDDSDEMVTWARAAMAAAGRAAARPARRRPAKA